MSKTRSTVVVVALVILAAAGWHFYQRGSSSAATQTNQSAADEVTALVRTQALKKQSLPTEVTAYGDVTTGKVEGVSFPRAGQVLQLLVTQGQLVKRGTPLATLASDPNARMAYDQAINAVSYAEGEVKRNQELFGLQLATQSQVDAGRKALQDARANLAAQRQLGGNINAATVAAPFDGVVTALTVSQGDRIQPGANLLQLGHTDSMRVQLGIEPGDEPLIKAGMPVTLTPVQNDQQRLQAAITMIQDLIDPKTQLLNALVVLPAQSSGFLVPGMRVRAAIHAGQHEAWTLPRQAVLSDEQGDYIFQVADGKAHRVAVTKGQQSQGLVAVAGPLQTDQPVVILGNYEVQDGMKVREGAQ
jgi:membrane fusion protein (multidrug efflux system)